MVLQETPLAVYFVASICSVHSHPLHNTTRLMRADHFGCLRSETGDYIECRINFCEMEGLLIVPKNGGLNIKG